MSYNGYTLGQYIFVNVNRIYSCEILDMPCVMSGHVSCSVTSSNLSYPGMLCHVSCVMCHVSYVICHVSCAMCHVSYVKCHASCIMHHVSHLTCHVVSCIMSGHVSCHIMCQVMQFLMSRHVSCNVMCNVLWVMRHASCVMHHMSYVASCVILGHM